MHKNIYTDRLMHMHHYKGKKIRVFLFGDYDTFSRYSTAIKDRSHLKQKKLELERYTTALGAGIAQIATQLQDPESNTLLLALQQEAASETERCGRLLHF